MREELTALAEKAIAEKTFPGCVLGVIGADSRRDIFAFGHLTYEEISPKVREDTIYDLASVTKSIPVASLVALFLADTRLHLADKIAKFLPELQNDFGATIEDLLLYRVKGPRMSAIHVATFEQLRTHIFENGFDGPPGESEYSNLPAFLLGIVLERVGGEILPALAHHYFFGPLEMHETTFFPHDVSRIAPTEVLDGAEIRGIVHDESARIFALQRRAVGHAGLFSSAPDMLKFLGALLQGEFPPVLEAAKGGLGWQRLPEGRFGKTGFTGTFVAADPAQKRALVLLSNRTYPKRPPDNHAIQVLREQLAGVVFSS